MHFSGQGIPIVAKSSLRGWQNMTRYPQQNFRNASSAQMGHGVFASQTGRSEEFHGCGNSHGCAVSKRRPREFRSVGSFVSASCCLHQRHDTRLTMNGSSLYTGSATLIDGPACICCWPGIWPIQLLTPFFFETHGLPWKWNMDTRFLMFSYGMDFWKLWKDWVDKLQLKGFCCLENADELQHL